MDRIVPHRGHIIYRITGWGNPSCPYCFSITEYVYHIWYRCRDCGRWADRQL